jgi:hypothetical protein
MSVLHGGIGAATIIKRLAMSACVKSAPAADVYGRRMSSSPPSSALSPASSSVLPNPVPNIYGAYRATGYVTRLPSGQSITRFPRPPKRRRRSWSALQQAAAASFALVACLGIGILGTDEYVARRKAADAAAAFRDEHRYTGSIVFYPNFGLTCHQLLFNNLDGQFTDNGYVDCARALYPAADATPKMLSAARTEVIRDSFRK